MTREEIKTWLKSTGHNRTWLAEQMGYALCSINRILYGKEPISARAELSISRLMQNHSSPDSELQEKASPPKSVLVLSVSPAEFDTWNDAAMAQNKRVSDWAISVLNNATPVSEVYEPGENADDGMLSAADENI